jgi:lysophospholipase L1-like esterase
MSNVYQVDDPVLNWRYVPGSEYREGDVIYRFNNNGFRDADRNASRPAEGTRVLVLGDSVTVGLGVRWESSFSSRLQQGLGGGTEVVTIAQGGLNTSQEVHLLERNGLGFNPDVVVINFVLNDCDFYSEFKNAGRYVEEADSRIGLLFNMPINPGLKRALKSSALIYFVKGRLEYLKGRLVGGEYTDYFTEIWGSAENRRRVSNSFDRLVQLQTDRGFDIVVLIWPLITDYRGYMFDSVHDWVAQEATSRGFATIDLLSAFSKRPYRDLQVAAEDNVHPNDVGHGIAAEQLLQWFRAGGRVERTSTPTNPKN